MCTPVPKRHRHEQTRCNAGQSRGLGNGRCRSWRRRKQKCVDAARTSGQGRRGPNTVLPIRKEISSEPSLERIETEDESSVARRTARCTRQRHRNARERSSKGDVICDIEKRQGEVLNRYRPAARL